MNRKQKVIMNKTKILIRLEFLKVLRTIARVSTCYRSIVAYEVDPQRDSEDDTRVDADAMEFSAEDEQNSSSWVFI